MKRTFITAMVIVGSMAVTASVVYAAGMTADWLRVGGQESGGVTFFNGTILNDTTTDGADNPVTFGDNVRIDGRVFRGAAAGTSDTLPFIVNDNMEVVGDLTVGGSSLAQRTVYEGTIDVSADGDEVVNRVSGSPTPCLFDDGVSSTDYHYKIVSIPELELTDMPNIAVYYKRASGSTLLPNNGDVWSTSTGSSIGITFLEGQAYVYYKSVENICDGSTIDYNAVSEYKIVVVE